MDSHACSCSQLNELCVPDSLLEHHLFEALHAALKGYCFLVRHVCYCFGKVIHSSKNKPVSTVDDNTHTQEIENLARFADAGDRVADCFLLTTAKDK